MTGRPIPMSAEQAQDMIEAIVRARRQVNVADIAAAMRLSITHTKRHLRALQLDDRLHKVRPFGETAPAGGIWAPGPDPEAQNGEAPEHEPVHLTTKNWTTGRVRASWLELHFFGRVAESEVRS